MNCLSQQLNYMGCNILEMLFVCPTLQPRREDPPRGVLGRLRRVACAPKNMPNQAMLEANLGRALSMIPDPLGSSLSLGGSRGGCGPRSPTYPRPSFHLPAYRRMRTVRNVHSTKLPNQKGGGYPAVRQGNASGVRVPEHEGGVGAPETERVRKHGRNLHAVDALPRDRHVGENGIEVGDVGARLDIVWSTGRFAPEAVIQKLSLRGAVVQPRKADGPYEIPFSYLGDSLRPNPASRPITTACARLLAPSLLKIIDT